MGRLYPTLCMECVPGDKFNLSCESLLRFAPLVSPVMHRFDVYHHYYFVPNRITWPNWEKFITNTEVLGALPAFPHLTMTAITAQLKTLANYLGIPEHTGGMTTSQVSALPFAAYQKIYNEYYRDQNLAPEINAELIDGDNMVNLDLLELRERCWEHDYFTSALPFAQKGNAVQIPSLLGDLPIRMWDAANPGPGFMGIQGAAGPFPGGPNINIALDASHTSTIPANELYADAATATGTINDLRTAFRLQEFLERNARGGTRYVENILAHFGVQSSDKRLQRPEYITGTKSPVMISEVLSTADTAVAPQGNMAGHAVSITNGEYGNYFCEEHGYIIGIMSVMPKTAYQQGIPKHFLKTTDPFQFYWPTFANIGEQEVQNQEIFAGTATATDTFGYVPRYAEYKYHPSRVAGDFADSLDFWHMGRIFTAQPSLNQSFVECVPGKRIFAVSVGNEDSLYAQVLHKIRAIRAMPKYGNPSF